MPAYVALLRAVNVGGTGKLPMADLRALCEKAGFAAAQTYIQSGSVVFLSPLPEAKVKATLEKALTTRLGKPALVVVRNAGELRDVVKHNPFQDAPPNRVVVLFVDQAPPKNALAGLQIPGREQIKLRGRELFSTTRTARGHPS